MSYRPESVLKGQVAVCDRRRRRIGFETSKALSENGALVVISDLNVDRGKKVAGELDVELYPADLTRAADVSNLARRVQEKHGRIDIAFNNTGITFVGIPEFQSLGSVIGQNVAGIVAGKTSLDQTLKANQVQAERVMKQAGYLK